jgi:CAAX protease family protein
MTLTQLDHLFMLVLVAILPVEGYFSFQEFLALLRHDDPKARSRALVRTIALEWLLVAALAAGWNTAARPWSVLGLVASSTAGTVGGLAAVAAAAVLVVLQNRGIAGLSAERRQRFVERTGDSLKLLPVTRAESRLFAATAVTAGICEELLCRGFMLWYLGHWMGAWTAVVAASVPFGVAHIYQGPKGALRAGVIALLVGSLYVLTGSLLWPILVHVTIDLAAGMLGPILAPSTSAGLPASAAQATA